MARGSPGGLSTQRGLLAAILVVTGLACCCSALRNVMLSMPPVARAGGSVTLNCLYDLEGAKLYAVKWYRGNFEFYRAMPHEQPAKQAFPYPDFHVDLSQSDEHRVTLHRVPLHMSGTFACEVSTDAPSFSTFVKKGQLSIVDTLRRPVLTVSKDVYQPGDELEANCTLPASAEPLDHDDGHHGHHLGYQLPSLLPQSPPLQSHQLNAEQQRHLQREAANQPPASFGFWINNRQVPSALVRVGPSTATLRRALAKDDFSVEGEMRLKCVVTLADKYREPSHVVTVRRRDELEEPPVVVAESDLVNAVDEPMPGPADRSAAAGAGAVAVRFGPGVLMILVTVTVEALKYLR